MRPPKLKQGSIDKGIGYELIWREQEEPERIAIVISCTDHTGKPLLEPTRLLHAENTEKEEPWSDRSRMLRDYSLLQEIFEYFNRGGDLEYIHSLLAAVECVYRGSITIPGYRFMSACEEVDTKQAGNIFISDDGKNAVTVFQNAYVDGPTPVEGMLHVISNVVSTGDQIALRALEGF